MRISSQSFSSNMLLHFNKNNARLFEVQNKIALQTRLLKPSDDPIANTQLSLLRREQSAIDQYQTNITRLAGNLAGQENSIKGSEQQLLAMKDKLEEALGGTLSQDDMDGYGKELASMLEATIALVNTRDESGRYMFSGTKSTQQPLVFDDASGNWSYQGNQDSASTSVSNGMDVEVTTHLAQAFGDNLETLNQLHAISQKMQDDSLTPEEYFNEIREVFASVSASHSKVAAIYTELGGRQNNLTLLQDAHADNSVVNDTVMRGLTELDIAEASIDLTRYYNAIVGAQKSYVQINQLSLFSLI